MYKVTHGRTRREFDNFGDAFTCMDELLTARQKDEKMIREQRDWLRPIMRPIKWELDPANSRDNSPRTISAAVKVGRYWLRVEVA